MKPPNDSRPTLRTIRREKASIDALISSRQDSRVMGYLLGLNAALLWMSNRGTAPPTVMATAFKEMLAYEQRRRKRKERLDAD